MSQDLASLVSRLEKVALRLESAGAGSVSGGAAAPAAASAAASSDDASGNASIDGYDEVLASVASFVAQGKALGDDVATMAEKIDAAFQAQRAFLVTASKSKEPSQEVLGTLLKPTSDIIGSIVELREANRRSKQSNHLSAVSEGIPALGWVAVKPKPAPFVKDMKDAAQFYVNRVLTEFKTSDPKQVEWAKSWNTVLEDLQAYIKRVHTTGLVWNPKGGDAASAAPAAAPKPKPAAAAKPATAAKPALGGGLFAELNKGGDITSGLKKVEKSQMTHKNPELRASSVVTADAAKKPVAPAKKFGGATDVAKDPVCELQGKKWVVEYQRNSETPVVIEDTDVRQTVYIYKCENTTIQIKGKVNSISVDGCKRVGVVFDNVVAACELVNCQRMQIQVTGAVPTVNIDKSDGVQVYLSKDSLHTQIVTAKSSEMNVSVPSGDDGDFVEFPVPEQFKTTFDGKKLVTEMTDIAG